MFVVISVPRGKKGNVPETLIKTSLTKEQIDEIDRKIFDESYDEKNFRKYDGEEARFLFMEKIEELDPSATYEEFYGNIFDWER